jgi:hypothetical protein
MSTPAEIFAPALTKKPWRLVSMMLHGESKERWSVSMDQPLK